MFTKEIEHIGAVLLRMGLAVFFAAALVHLFLSVMNVQVAMEQLTPPLPHAQNLVPVTPEWSSECSPQKTLIAGVGLGNAEQLFNPQTLAWPYAGELVTMQAQVAGVITNEPLPDAVVFSTDTGEQVSIINNVANEVAYYFSASLLPASNVTSTILLPANHQTAVPQPPSPQNGLPPKGSTPRGLALYAQVVQPDQWTSVGRFTLASVASQRDIVDSAEELLTFPPLKAETDLMVTAVSIDNDPDDRAIIIRASAGGVFTSVTETAPTNGDILNITTLTLTAVPTGTSQLSLTIKSPASPAGDSATLIGLNLNYRCGNAPDAVDLVIEQVSAAPQVPVNTAVSFTVSVTNISELTATNVIVTNSLQSNSSFTPNLPWLSCLAPNDPNVCYLGDLPPGATDKFTLWLTPTSAGTITNTAVATSDQPDPTTPNIATTTLVVTEDAFTNQFYLPLILKPGGIAVTVTHSQNPAINHIPYRYYISVTNTGDRTIPNLIIQDDFDERLLVEQMTPPIGCFGAVQPPEDLIVYCDDGLAVGKTLTFNVRVRPNITMPVTVLANVKTYSLEPGFFLNNDPQITPTQINLCVENPSGVTNAYGPLLFGETYCGQVQAEKYARYFFTFTLTRPGHITATFRSPQVPWVSDSVNYPSASQLAFTTITGGISSSLPWCCNKRTKTIVIENTYLDAGQKMLMVRSLETFSFTYTLKLEYWPIYLEYLPIFNNGKAVSSSPNTKAFADVRLLGTIATNNDRHTGWQTAVFFTGFISVAFGLVYRQRKRNI